MISTVQDFRSSFPGPPVHPSAEHSLPVPSFFKKGARQVKIKKTQRLHVKQKYLHQLFIIKIAEKRGWYLKK